jgi:hypothetical protein
MFDSLKDTVVLN